MMAIFKTSQYVPLGRAPPSTQPQFRRPVPRPSGSNYSKEQPPGGWLMILAMPHMPTSYSASLNTRSFSEAPTTVTKHTIMELPLPMALGRPLPSMAPPRRRQSPATAFGDAGDGSPLPIITGNGISNSMHPTRLFAREPSSAIVTWPSGHEAAIHGINKETISLSREWM